MITIQEVEMLAVLLQRAGVNAYEMIWANAILDRLRAEAARTTLEPKEDIRDEEIPTDTSG